MALFAPRPGYAYAANPMHTYYICSIIVSFGQVHIKHAQPQVVSPDWCNNGYDSVNTANGAVSIISRAIFMT